MIMGKGLTANQSMHVVVLNDHMHRTFAEIVTGNVDESPKTIFASGTAGESIEGALATLLKLTMEMFEHETDESACRITDGSLIEYEKRHGEYYGGAK